MLAAYYGGHEYDAEWPAMLIVSGWLRVEPSERLDYLRGCESAVGQARTAPGCLDFSLSADLLDEGRINVYERWASEPELMAFRGSGPDDEQASAILDADVRRFDVLAEGPP